MMTALVDGPESGKVGPAVGDLYEGSVPCKGKEGGGETSLDRVAVVGSRARGRQTNDSF